MLILRRKTEIDGRTVGVRLGRINVRAVKEFLRSCDRARVACGNVRVGAIISVGRNPREITRI
jgi:hypothetical protein